MLNSNQRILLKRLQCKLSICWTKCFGIKHCMISIKQILNNIQDSRLTRTRSAIKNNKFLNSLWIACNDWTNSPFKFMPLFFIVQGRDNLVIRGTFARFKRVVKSLTSIIFFICPVVSKHELLIEHVVRISHLLLTELMPSINHSRLGIPHITYLDITVDLSSVLFSVFSKFPVHQLHNVILVSRP